MTKHFRYPCVRVRQEPASKDLLLFSASAVDIDEWVGIPQRLSLEGSETAGFQRTVSPKREEALRRFFSEERNVTQNPLLCAIRRSPGLQIGYEPSSEDPDIGHVTIQLERFEQHSMLQLFSAARAYLEERVPELAERVVPSELVSEIESKLSSQTGGVQFLLETDEETDAANDDDDAELEEPAEEALFDESQITDFWDQIRAREEVCKKIPAAQMPDIVHGFSREMLVSYLKPIILVDGQHRLRGAMLAAEDEADNSQEAKEMIIEGTTAGQARLAFMRQRSRRLPVSLLMNESPAEHVFQYVLVNQKATPVPKALLGTIISTSLAGSELQTIAERLEDAKIQLEGSRVVSILSRAASSPFRDLVAKGLQGEGNEKLQWNVLSSLADVFRYLEGGRYYHESTDYAKTWRNHHLEASGIVAEWHARGYQSTYEYWQDLNGPWIDVFQAFWTSVRDSLANTVNPDAPNFWGDNKTSTIFNKPMLHILTADFFEYLQGKKARIGEVGEIKALVTDWLEYASPQYFARDWKLAGVKKDSVGTRRQWSRLWASHRRTGIAVPPGQFSQISKS
ncbi:MAG: hypothetical protein J0I07_26210 [Myxococcales bacterium]|nr:hypothetical protein [Myxococcales bacterium]